MLQQNHASSQLLYDHENNNLHRLIGRKAECLSMAVIQLFFTKPPTHAQWFKESAGVLCFIKDNVRREFTFKVYNMDSKYNTLIFEEDLHAEMDYSEDNNFFHTIQTDDRIIAFNFASNYEASIMNTKVQERLQWLKIRLQNQMNPQPRFAPLDMNHQNKYTNSSSTSFSTNPKKITIKKRDGKHFKITKSDIGSPSNFVHTLHYGINMEKNFALEDCPVQLRNALQDVNITNQQLQNPEIRELIRNTLDLHQVPEDDIDIRKEIEREENYMIRHMSRRKIKSPQMILVNNIKTKQFNVHTEIERDQNYMTRYKEERDLMSMKEEINILDGSIQQNLNRQSSSGVKIAVDNNELLSAINKRADGSNMKTPQRVPSLKNHNRPMTLLQRNDSKVTNAKPKQQTYNMTSRPLPPIPAQDKTIGSYLHAHTQKPPLSPSLITSSNALPVTPPPPPPPPPNLLLNENTPNNQNNTDGRAALFDAIKKGTNLKAPDLCQSTTAGLGSSRNDLLTEIRMGKQLTPVQARNDAKDADEPLNAPGNDLAAALSRALKIRNVAMQSEDDNSGNETEESNEEWDA